ncbi:Pectinesterase inhibitor domain [Macleaya cordata]|uniref:Pectinesterase inhibitor domain n=1 Tax=Macleaya cordata TaxID=56857 RepID=A0A200RC62_MACCD|nr:Pectinesterase inhibitor domain [Macleaya cordata]
MRSSFSLVSSSFALIVLIFFSHGVNGIDLVRGTCKRVAKTNPKLYYPFCVRSFGANIRSKTADLAGLGIISTDLAISNAKFIKLYAKNMLKDQQKGDGGKALQDCLEVFTDAIPQLNEVKQAFLSKDYSTANIKMSAAMDASSTCEDGLKEKNITVPSFTKKNEEFSQLAAITLAITNLVNNP